MYAEFTTKKKTDVRENFMADANGDNGQNGP